MLEHLMLTVLLLLISSRVRRERKCSLLWKIKCNSTTNEYIDIKQLYSKYMLGDLIRSVN